MKYKDAVLSDIKEKLPSLNVNQLVAIEHLINVMLCDVPISPPLL